MEDFKKDIDAQHAPQALVESTINRIHSEEMKKNNSGFEQIETNENNKRKLKGNHRKMKTAGLGVIAACMVLVAAFSIRKPQFVYNEMAISVDKGSQEREDLEEISLEEYEQYFDMDLSGQLADFEIEKTDIAVRYNTDGTQIIDDLGTFYLRLDNQVVILKISGTHQPAPETLISGTVSNVKDVDVYIGVTESMNQFEASFQRENVNFYLSCRDVSQNDFEKILKKIVK